MTIKEYYVGSKKLYSARFWYYKNGIKKSKYKQGFEKKKDARLWGVTEKARLEGLTLNADRIKVSAFLDDWIAKKEKNNKLAPTTLNGYKVNIEHAKKHIGDTVVSRLKNIDIQDMADALSNSGLKHNTVKYIIRTLHSAFEYAIKKELLIKNPCKDINITEDEKPFEYSIYTADDLGNLIIALREQNHYIYPAILLASMRGLRRGECLGLSYSDIDFDKGIAHIQNTYVIVNKIPYLKKVKTKESNARIDISGFLAAELIRLKEESAKNGIIKQFVCEVDGKLPDPSHVSRALKSFQKANGFPECRFHDLRHTFAMLQLESGTELETLKRLLRHSKVAVTEIYTHENMKTKKAASAKMDKILKFDCDKIVTKLEKTK